jgi:hypothetical protein
MYRRFHFASIDRGIVEKILKKHKINYEFGVDIVEIETSDENLLSTIVVPELKKKVQKPDLLMVNMGSLVTKDTNFTLYSK